jgi:hypothetical protein
VPLERFRNHARRQIVEEDARALRAGCVGGCDRMPAGRNCPAFIDGADTCELCEANFVRDGAPRAEDHVYPSFGLLSEGRRRWCSGCAQHQPDAVDYGPVGCGTSKCRRDGSFSMPPRVHQGGRREPLGCPGVEIFGEMVALLPHNIDTLSGAAQLESAGHTINASSVQKHDHPDNQQRLLGGQAHADEYSAVTMKAVKQRKDTLKLLVGALQAQAEATLAATIADMGEHPPRAREELLKAFRDLAGAAIVATADKERHAA